MPGRTGSTRAQGRRAAAVAAATVAFLTLSAKVALAAPPTPGGPADGPGGQTRSPCDGLIGAAKDYCTKGDPSAPAKGTNPTDSLDPLSSLAKGCAQAASWTIDKLSAAVTKTTEVDFTNGAFLRQYAVVFAASTILTLVLWLLAVAKRAVRGVPLTEALTEAVGFLWLTVLASAFTPLILYTVVSATDAVTAVVSSGTQSDTQVFFGSFSGALTKGTDIGGGPIMLIVVSLVSVLAAGVLWLELVIRAALLYVGALLGTAVYAGLVDKNMWHHVRRWAGIMIAVIMVKPVIVIVLGLAGALLLQFRVQRYSPWIYWLAVVMVSVFGTMAADVVHVVAGVPYAVSTVAFSVLLVVVLTAWYRSEGTLSIHSISTPRRERFYWATVLTTFALGTACGDLTAGTLHLGYFSSGVLFAVAIVVPALARLMGLNAVAAFWWAYILTRPLGASFADWMGVPTHRGGLGWGTGPVSLALAALIVVAVGYLAAEDRRSGTLA
ncbi:COG4705 family protein [Actinacidiphila rubida]|uniref:COG4705 family protein n=1 Tax=Actinacidiphila rubida TaxID=310780 RepID=UPI00099FCEA2|nr:hypothetical protein [Actinacidiphila rubida]